MWYFQGTHRTQPVVWAECKYLHSKSQTAEHLYLDTVQKRKQNNGEGGSNIPVDGLLSLRQQRYTHSSLKVHTLFPPPHFFIYVHNCDVTRAWPGRVPRETCWTHWWQLDHQWIPLPASLYFQTILITLFCLKMLHNSWVYFNQNSDFCLSLDHI